VADRKKVLTQLAEIGIGLDMAGYHDDAQCVRDALAMLREPARGWISVKDRLPENRSMCLTYSPKGKMRVAQAFLPNPDDHPNDCWWSVHGQGAHYVAVTHWMPLPEPPEEVSEDA